MGATHVYSQISTVASASSCTCSGSITFTNVVSGSATYTLSSQTGVVVSSSSTATGTFSASNLCPEIYLLTITQGGNATTIPFNISAAAFNPGNATSLQLCTTIGMTNLNNNIVGLAPSGIWTSPSGTVFSGIINPATAQGGLYIYSVDQGGCQVTTGIWLSIIQNANPGQSTTYLICENYLPFEMLTFMAGGPDSGGQWFASGGIPMNGIFDPASMNTALFTYMIDNVAGCNPVFATMFVAENTIPNSGTNADLLVCAGGTTFNMSNYLGGNPSSGGIWYNSLNQVVSSTFNPATQPEGVYRYSIDAATPCVNQNSYLTITFTSNNPSGSNASIQSCQNAAPFDMTTQLGGSPMSGGNWTNSSGQPVASFFNSATQTSGIFSYSFQSVGCTPNSAQLNITVENLLNAGLNNSVTLCDTQSSLNLNTLLSTGTTLGGNWLNSSGTVINPNLTLNVGNNQLMFTYNLTGVECPSDAANFTIISQVAPLAVNNQNLTLCVNDDPFALNSIYPLHPNIEIETTNGLVVNNLFDPANGGNYTYLAINASGNTCPDAQATLTIQVDQPSFQSSSLSLDLCESQLIFDLNTSQQGIIFPNGNWTNSSGDNIPNLVDLNFLGPTNFQFTSSQSNSCEQSTLEVTLNVFDFTEAGSNTGITLCSDASPSTLSALSGVSAIGGSWFYNNQPVVSGNFNPGADSPGAYTYQIPANAPCPASTAQLNIAIQNGLQFSTGPDVEVCNDQASVQIGQQNPLINQYNWQPTQNLNNTSIASPTFTLPATGNNFIVYSYSVIATDGICTATDTVNITVYPNPEIPLSPTYTLCEGESIMWQLAVGNTYNWSPFGLFNDASSPIQQLTPTDNVSVSVEAQNVWGCSSSTQLEVIVNPAPIISFDDLPVAGCPPLNLTFALDESSENINELTWIITNEYQFSGDTMNTDLSMTGFYDLQIIAISDQGCSSAIILNNQIEVFPKPRAEFFSDPIKITTIDPLASFVNQSEGANSYDWTFDQFGTSNEENPSFEFPGDEPRNMEICLEAKNTEGCSDTYCLYLELENEYILFAPNAFTPDDDGVNDVFLPIIRGFDESSYTLRIFDRWGNLIFATNRSDEPWTGNVTGGQHYAQADTYVWRIDVKDLELADFQTFEGHITVIR